MSATASGRSPGSRSSDGRSGSTRGSPAGPRRATSGLECALVARRGDGNAQSGVPSSGSSSGSSRVGSVVGEDCRYRIGPASVLRSIPAPGRLVGSTAGLTHPGGGRTLAATVRHVQIFNLDSSEPKGYTARLRCLSSCPQTGPISSALGGASSPHRTVRPRHVSTASGLAKVSPPTTPAPLHDTHDLL